MQIVIEEELNNQALLKKLTFKDIERMSFWSSTKVSKIEFALKLEQQTNFGLLFRATSRFVVKKDSYKIKKEYQKAWICFLNYS